MSRLLIILLLLLGPPPAAWALDCGQIAAMGELVDARHDLAGHPSLATDTLHRLRGALGRVDRTTIQRDTARLPDALDRKALVGLAILGEQIASAARRSDPDLVAGLLIDPRAAAVFNDAGAVLRRLRCDQTASPRAATGDKSTSALAGGEGLGLSWLRSSLQQLRIAPGLVPQIAALGLIAAGAAVLLQQRNLKRRRARRYAVLRDVTMHCRDTGKRGTIVDLSCFGAKLRHNGFITDRETPFAIALLGRVRRCEVTWLDDEYAGLQFADRLRLSQVLRIVARIAPDYPAPPIPVPKTETAPARGGRIS